MLLNSSFLPLPSFFKPRELGRTNILGHTNGYLLVLSSYATSTNINVSQRKSANYQPNIWNYDTLQSLNHDYTDLRYAYKGRRLQEKVRSMIKDENVEILELINTLKHLGLNDRFEKEIREAIDRLLSLEKSQNTIIHTSLHEVALRFKLLREYGYDISTDIFETFKDHNGNFKACLVKDIKGMLSLYEASFLSYEGEQILDEANAFTSFHLRGLNEDKSNFLFEQVNHSLELPLHHRFQRLEARWYIESYQKRKDANQVLLEAAKLDFNVVQSNLQQELKEMSKWWKGMGLSSRLSFGRDRLMECYFWAVGMSPFEPQFSDLRKGLTKVASLITLIDDIYDVYGTLDELELFTMAVERWDINYAIQILPEYMKIFFLALYNTLNEFAYDTLKEKGHDILPYLVKAWSDMLKAFLQEARWSHDKQLPKFDNYLNNAWVSVSGVVLLTHAYFLLNHSITKEGLQSLENCHMLLRRPSIIFRLCNDLATSSAEIQRGEGANSIICYMNENSVGEEAAYKHIKNLLNETWKKMNKDRVTNSTFSKYFVEIAINLARISHCTYQYGDGHGAPDTIAKNRIKSLILEPID